jgi:hypothetical protein
MTEWRMVPVEPTEEMTNAYYDKACDSCYDFLGVDEAWREMLAAAAPPPPSPWRDIASAPRDGTYILVCGPWEDDVSWIDGSAPIVAVACWNDDCWWSGRGAYGFTVFATHWMPLPAPPQSSSNP